MGSSPISSIRDVSLFMGTRNPTVQYYTIAQISEQPDRRLLLSVQLNWDALSTFTTTTGNWKCEQNHQLETGNERKHHQNGYDRYS